MIKLSKKHQIQTYISPPATPISNPNLYSAKVTLVLRPTMQTHHTDCSKLLGGERESYSKISNVEFAPTVTLKFAHCVLTCREVSHLSTPLGSCPHCPYHPVLQHPRHTFALLKPLLSRTSQVQTIISKVLNPDSPLDSAQLPPHPSATCVIQDFSLTSTIMTSF